MRGRERRLRRARRRMVRRDVKGRGISDPRVLAAMAAVPREAFVGPGQARRAYADGPLPIGEGQTISQPYVVAWMAEAAEVAPGDRVLEVGTGSGYAAAVLGRLAESVYTVERRAVLAKAAVARLRTLGCDNVNVRHGDGNEGWSEHAPYDAILVTAAGPGVPVALREQLRTGGRLVMPLGGRWATQRLVRERCAGAGGFTREELGAVRFVPLVDEVC